MEPRVNGKGRRKGEAKGEGNVEEGGGKRKQLGWYQPAGEGKGRAEPGLGNCNYSSQFTKLNRFLIAASRCPKENIKQDTQP